jgi:uncharacterized membrane protein YfcA
MGLDPLFVALLAIIGAGAYLQAVTGFAFGLVVLGVVTIFELASVELMAAVVSLGTLINTTLGLRGRLALVCWRDTGHLLAGMLPAVFAGVVLLEYLSGSAVAILHTTLAVTILVGGGLLALAPHTRVTPSGRWKSLAMGSAGGLFTGLLAAGGPPVVYHLYRQPYPVAAVRATLLAVFAIACVGRLGHLLVAGGIDGEVLAVGLPSLPVVVAATELGRRCPPPLSELVLRRLAFGLLMLLGAVLLAV